MVRGADPTVVDLGLYQLVPCGHRPEGEGLALCVHSKLGELLSRLRSVLGFPTFPTFGGPYDNGDPKGEVIRAELS